jgi:hypothetical protein
VSLSAQLYRGVPLDTLAQVSGGPVVVSEYVDATLNPGANAGTINQGQISGLTPTPAGLSTTPVLPGAASVSGPGGAWLLEWNVLIPVNGSFILSKDINAEVLQPAPEPTALPMVSLGLIVFGAAWMYRRRSAAS